LGQALKGFRGEITAVGNNRGDFRRSTSNRFCGRMSACCPSQLHNPGLTAKSILLRTPWGQRVVIRLHQIYEILFIIEGRSHLMTKALRRRAPIGKRHRKCLLVLGMHRSGTSALTRVLNLLGAELPRGVMGAGEGNETGHWEPERLVAYHERLLSELGSTWYDWRPLDMTRVPVAQREQFKADIRKIIATEYGDAPLFIVKDPRICRFADFFIEALEEDGIDVAPIISIRNPLEVTASLRNRASVWPAYYTEADAALLWLTHTLDSERMSRERTRAIVNYDALIADWRGLAAAIKAQTNCEFPVEPEEAAPLVDEFLSGDMRHHVYKASDVALDPVLKGWVSESFEAMVKLAAKPGALQPTGVLDRVFFEFLRSVPIIDNLVSMASAARTTAVSEAEEARTKAAAAESSLAERATEMEEARAKLERLAALEQELSEAREKEQHFAAVLEEARGDAATAELKLAEHEKELEHARKELNRLAGLEQNLSNAQKKKEILSAQVATWEQLAQAADKGSQELEAANRIAQEEASQRGAESDALYAEREQMRLLVEAFDIGFADQNEALFRARAALGAQEGDNRDLDQLASALKEALQKKEQAWQQSEDARIAAERHAEALNSMIAATEDKVRAQEAELAPWRLRVHEMSGEIAAQVAELNERAREITLLKTELEQSHAAYRSSTSWKLTKPLRTTKAFFRDMRFAFRTAPAAIRRGGGLLRTAKTAVRVHREEGIGGVKRRLNSLPTVHRLPDMLPAEIMTGERDQDPLVSIIIVNWNGADHLPDVLNSIKAQTYGKYEIVIVDNGSVDQSKSIIKNITPDAKLVNLEKNVGFAEANNIGFEKSRGELVALLNNDTRVDEKWLYKMVNRLNTDQNIAAIAPKIRFWTRFQTVELRSRGVSGLDVSSLEGSLAYKKYFIRSSHKPNSGFITFEKKEPLIIDLPLQETPFSISLRADDCSACSVRTNFSTAPVKVVPGSTASVTWDKKDTENGFYIINNAGGVEPTEYETGDRGFGERDAGQYEELCDVPLLCGCAVLLRRYAIQDKSLFIGDLFAYFEDSELSKRLTKSGRKIVYEPQAIIYHKHSATSKEKSALWIRLVNRNAGLYKYCQLSTDNRQEFKRQYLDRLNHIGHFYAGEPTATKAEKEFSANLNEIMKEFSRICGEIDNNSAYRPPIRRIGIYNSFWNTFGGGEAHALAFAEALQHHAVVDLISEQTFSIGRLSEYFDADLKNVRRRIVNQMTEEITGEYDVFINSTYCSSLVPRAAHSFYIVSFPHRGVSKEFLKKYTFLPNSDYTFGWMKKMWSDVEFRATKIYPSVSEKLIPDSANDLKDKKKTIISVGRFFRDGHSKNQVELVRAFRQFRLKHPDIGAEWKLALIGSATHEDYVERVKRECEGLPVDVTTNATFAELGRIYKEATIYWHASGLNRDSERHPQNIEHFGMTTAEAIANGAFPIVYNVGGPAEIITKLGIGATFSNLDELVEKTAKFISEISGDSQASDQLVSRIAAAGRHYSRDSLLKRIDQIYQETLGNDVGALASRSHSRAANDR
jgi:GT2 family glycosyltransferase